RGRRAHRRGRVARSPAARYRERRGGPTGSSTRTAGLFPIEPAAWRRRATRAATRLLTCRHDVAAGCARADTGPTGALARTAPVTTISGSRARPPQVAASRATAPLVDRLSARLRHDGTASQRPPTLFGHAARHEPRPAGPRSRGPVPRR